MGRVCKLPKWLASMLAGVFSCLLALLPTLAHATSGISNPFELDTRNYLAAVSQASADFVLDTRIFSSSTASASATFVLNTRAASGLSGWGKTGTFVLDTRGITSLPLIIWGFTQDRATNLPLAGATVKLLRGAVVEWQGMASAQGIFQPPPLLAQNYVVEVSLAGYAPYIDNIAGSRGGAVTKVAQLKPLKPAPPSQVTARTTTLAEGQSAIQARAPNTIAGDPETQLRVYVGTTFVLVNSNNSTSVLRTDRPTIVLTHGWQAAWGEWPRSMAGMLKTQTDAANRPCNILAWDWETEANMWTPNPDKTLTQGELLGGALSRTLGAGYTGHIHFIGHSLGTLVNKYGCDRVHSRGAFADGAAGWAPAVTKPHVTLLDEAEVVSIIGSNVLVSAGVGARFSVATAAAAAIVAAVRDWKSPIPETPTTWIDNYISMVGVDRSQAVNVCLLKPALDLASPVSAHGYAYRWYQDSGVSPFPGIGYRKSLEVTGVLPPTGAGMTAGSLWRQFVGNGSEKELIIENNPLPGECLSSILSIYTVRSGAQAVSTAIDGATTAAKWSYDKFTTTSVWVAEKELAAAVATKNAVVTVGSKIGQGIDAAVDKALTTGAAVGQSLGSVFNPDVWTGDVTRPDLVMSMTTPVRIQQVSAPAPRANARLAAAATVASPGNEAGVWVTVSIPANAQMMQFDFKVMGVPASDRIAAAVAGQNVFELPALAVAGMEVQSTDMIYIANHAGQTVEMFFGLVGGTSSGCTLEVSGLRFITVPLPPLDVQADSTKVITRWPAAAAGWALESTSTLLANDWHEDSVATGLTVVDGVMTLEQPRNAALRFYRLRLRE